MPSHISFVSLIRSLGGADSSKRLRAARSIFACGRSLARAATAKWFADAELASCFPLNDSRLPKITVGLAVEPDDFRQIRAANDSPRLAKIPQGYDVVEFELVFPGGVRLDILTSRRRRGKGAIAKYLRNFGPGIQQVELLTSSVEKATEILRARFALEPLYPTTRAGADGARMNFFLAPATKRKKVLIELVEETRPSA